MPRSQFLWEKRNNIVAERRKETQGLVAAGPTSPSCTLTSAWEMNQPSRRITSRAAGNLPNFLMPHNSIPQPPGRNAAAPNVLPPARARPAAPLLAPRVLWSHMLMEARNEQLVAFGNRISGDEHGAGAAAARGAGVGPCEHVGAAGAVEEMAPGTARLGGEHDGGGAAGDGVVDGVGVQPVGDGLQDPGVIVQVDPYINAQLTQDAKRLREVAVHGPGAHLGTVVVAAETGDERVLKRVPG